MGRTLDVDAEQTLKEFEKLVADLAQPNYLFRLYVSGTSSRSATAITNVRRICDQYLPERYELEVIDVYQQPAITKTAQILAVPTLIKELPFPPAEVCRRYVQHGTHCSGIEFEALKCRWKQSNVNLGTELRSAS